MPSRNVGVFVDIISQFNSVNMLYRGRKLDYEKYLTKSTEQGCIYRAFGYGAQITNEAHAFITCLRTLGYEPKYVQARQFGERSEIRRTDRTMDLVTDIIRILEKLDVVIIGTSNPMIVPIIEFIKERGIKVIVFSCNIPRELKESADLWWEITEDYLEIKKENGITKTAE